jgi:hypothetical protein
MPTAIPVSTSFSVPTSSSSSLSRSDFSQLIPVVIFSAIGLLVSLVAFLSGVQGAWY